MRSGICRAPLLYSLWAYKTALQHVSEVKWQISYKLQQFSLR